MELITLNIRKIKKMNLLKKYKIIKSKKEFNTLLNIHHTNNEQETILNYSKNNYDPYYLGNYKGSMYIIYNEVIRNNFKIDKYNLVKKFVNIVLRNKYNRYPKNKLKEEIEKYLRNNDILQEIKILQKYILEHKIKTNIIAYRFSSLEEINQIKNRKKITYNQFLSVTCNPIEYKNLEMERDKTELIRILIPKKTKGIILPEIQEHIPEYEILLPYYTTLKNKGYSYDSNLNRKILTLKITKHNKPLPSR